MHIFLWFLSFIFMVVAAVVGVGASIGALEAEWFAVTVLCIAGMFSAAEWADSLRENT